MHFAPYTHPVSKIFKRFAIVRRIRTKAILIEIHTKPKTTTKINTDRIIPTNVFMFD